MSVIHRLAGKLFQRAGPSVRDTDSGEGRHEQPQEELEARCWREFSFWSWAGACVRDWVVAHAILTRLARYRVRSTVQVEQKITGSFLIVFGLNGVDFILFYLLARHKVGFVASSQDIHIWVCACTRAHMSSYTNAHREQLVCLYVHTVSCSFWFQFKGLHFSVTLKVSGCHHAARNRTLFQ